MTQAGSSTTVTWTDGTGVTYDANPHGATASWASTGADERRLSLPRHLRRHLRHHLRTDEHGPVRRRQLPGVGQLRLADANHAASSNTANFTINPANLILVKSVALQPSSNLATDNDFTRFANAMDSIAAGGTVEINGTLDWSEAHALASWQATGEAFAMPHLDGVTVDAVSPGSGIHGPGDNPTLSGEGPFYFDGLGTDKSWNISALQISNFDTAFFYSPEVDVTSYSGTHITNNTITVPSANPGAENGGIILGPSANQTVQGNTISITGNGGASSSSFGIDSFHVRRPSRLEQLAHRQQRHHRDHPRRQREGHRHRRELRLDRFEHQRHQQHLQRQHGLPGQQPAGGVRHHVAEQHHRSGRLHRRHHPQG